MSEARTRGQRQNQRVFRLVKSTNLVGVTTLRLKLQRKMTVNSLQPSPGPNPKIHNLTPGRAKRPEELHHLYDRLKTHDHHSNGRRKQSSNPRVNFSQPGQISVDSSGNTPTTPFTFPRRKNTLTPLLPRLRRSLHSRRGPRDEG